MHAKIHCECPRLSRVCPTMIVSGHPKYVPSMVVHVPQIPEYLVSWDTWDIPSMSLVWWYLNTYSIPGYLGHPKYMYSGTSDPRILSIPGYLGHPKYRYSGTSDPRILSIPGYLGHPKYIPSMVVHVHVPQISQYLVSQDT